ncbi:MAG: hypothetical protein R3C28_23110 [Pirellulaceae bacterium]
MAARRNIVRRLGDQRLNVEKLEDRQLLAADLANVYAIELGDFDGSQTLDVADLDQLSQAVRSGEFQSAFDVDGNGVLSNSDRLMWINQLARTYIGDSDFDGKFGTSDFVLAFQNDVYEDGIPNNATWLSGDWNGDGDFTTADFVTAFQEARL